MLSLIGYVLTQYDLKQIKQIQICSYIMYMILYYKH